MSIICNYTAPGKCTRISYDGNGKARLYVKEGGKMPPCVGKILDGMISSINCRGLNSNGKPLEKSTSREDSE